MPDSYLKSLAFEKLQTLPESFDAISAEDGKASEAVIIQVEECFNRMCSFWQKGDYEHIVSLADTLPLLCLCDIRICVYYLYSLWVTNPGGEFATVITTLTKVVAHAQHPWQATLNGKKNKTNAIVFNNSLALFFRKVHARLESPLNQQQSQNEPPQLALDSLDTVRSWLETQYNFVAEDVYSAIRCVHGCFSSQQYEIDQEKGLYDQQMLAQKSVEESLDNQHVEDASIGTQGCETLTSEMHPCHQKSLGIDTTQFKPSLALQLLFRRISIFEKLIESKQALKAAVVLENIQTELDNFNPLNYFPDYFTNFARLRATHACDLEPYFAQQKSYHWQVLHEYFHADMDAYLELEEPHAPPELTRGGAVEGEYSPQGYFESEGAYEQELHND